MATKDDGPIGPEDHDEEWEEEEASRSLLSATWFRVVIVVLVVGAVAAVSIPYVMDSVSAPPPAKIVAVPAAPAPAAPATPPTQPPVAPAPAAAPPAAAPPAAVAAVVTTLPEPAKPEPPKEVATAAKPEPAKAAPAKPEPAKPEPAKTPAAKGDAAKAAPVATAKPTERKTKAAAAVKAPAGDLWVQVGAFRDPATARRVAASLKEQGFSVTESTLTRGGGPDGTPSAANGVDRYDVVVTGGAPADVTRKLTAKGLSAEPRGDAAVVRPSLPLRDAVSLSNDLRGEGFSVTVRRVATAGGATPPAAPPAAAVAGERLHRVRVGAFPDRAAANAAVEKLRGLGYAPFVARGRE